MDIISTGETSYEDYSKFQVQKMLDCQIFVRPVLLHLVNCHPSKCVLNLNTTLSDSSTISRLGVKDQEGCNLTDPKNYKPTKIQIHPTLSVAL